MELSDVDRLAIIAGAVGFLVLCFLIMVCKLSPWCLCHNNCLLKPAFHDEEYAIYDKEQPPSYDATMKTPWEPFPKEPHDAVSKDDLMQEEQSSHVNRVSEDLLLSAPIKDGVQPSDVDEPTDVTQGTQLVRGEVELTLSYAPTEDQILMVQIVRLNNLIFRRRDKVKVCVKVQCIKADTTLEKVAKLFQAFSQEQISSKVEYEAQTSFKNLNKSLDFYETRYIPLRREDAPTRFLRVTCCLFDKLSQSTTIGETIIHLKDVELSEGETLTQQLVAAKQENRGDILVSLSYLPTAQKLTCQLVECKQMALVETTHPSYVSVRAGLVGRGSWSKKKTKQYTASPQLTFNESISFHNIPVEILTDLSLVLTVKQTVQYPDNPLEVNVGKIVIGLKAGSGPAQAHWRGMMTNQRLAISQWHILH